LLSPTGWRTALVGPEVRAGGEVVAFSTVAATLVPSPSELPPPQPTAIAATTAQAANDPIALFPE